MFQVKDSLHIVTIILEYLKLGQNLFRVKVYKKLALNLCDG